MRFVRHHTVRLRVPALAGFGLLLLTCGAWSAAPQKAAERPFLSDQDVPIASPALAARDGQPVMVLMRKPPGSGPFPALVYLHGGLTPWSASQLKDELMAATLSRFLAAGYAIVIPSLRRKREDPQSPLALWDAVAVVEHPKKVPGVDPASVVVWGDSGGGSLAFELAGEIELCAIGVQEPASVLFTGMYGKEHGTDNAKAMALMAKPRSAYTPEIEKMTREKIQRIHAPIFLAILPRTAARLVPRYRQSGSGACIFRESRSILSKIPAHATETHRRLPYQAGAGYRPPRVGRAAALAWISHHPCNG